MAMPDLRLLLAQAVKCRGGFRPAGPGRTSLYFYHGLAKASIHQQADARLALLQRPPTRMVLAARQYLPPALGICICLRQH